MRGELVAIDLETTGLDASQDEIIEVGAVRFVDGKIVDEYSTLVNPNRAIPALVTNITGIRNDDVIGAPLIQTVLPQISAFIGHATLIGHNIGHDTSFLGRQGILQNNLRIDTYDLASVLMPRAARYSLSNLTREIGINLENAHRALDDARATGLFYNLLWDKLLELPIDTLAEICYLARDLAWDSGIVFEAALEQRIQRGENPAPLDFTSSGLFSQETRDYPVLRPREQMQPVSETTVRELLDREGLLAKNLPGYEHRPQQISMSTAITNAFNQSRHLMIEAGTGTGKSIAYLVPTILWALQNNERVVISTNTINLQEQLIYKDIPLLKAAMNLDFEAAVLKGRGNYLCPRRLTAARRRRPTSVEELRTLAKILVWLLETTTGDKGEISLRGPVENITWQRLSAEDEGCTLDRCHAAMEGLCPFYKARKAAESAHVVVVNHALLITDATSDSRVLPDYQYLVIDEAHHLEEATTNGLSFRIDESTLRRRLADLGGPNRGLLGNLLQSAAVSAPDKDMMRLRAFVEMVSEVTSLMEAHVGNLFNALRKFTEDATGGRFNDYSTQVRVTANLRNKNSFSGFADAWQTLKEFFEALRDAMHQLTLGLNKLRNYQVPDYEDLVNSIGSAANYLDEVAAQLEAFTHKPDDNSIYWLNIAQDLEHLSLHAAPLHVGPMVDEYLWGSKHSVIMTSATLQTNRSFDYIRDRLNAQEVKTLEVGSPFDYSNSTLLYVPTDIPEPSDRNRYQQTVERGLIELAAALNGRVLALFTSYSQLRQTAQAITPRLALGNITVFDQSDGSSRQALLDGFKAADRAVLLGTRSFWEGIDIPGEALSALVIVRLPFAVPSDPVFAARSETYGNSFNEYALPDAILRFRQGFGRLIRSQSDRGIVTIFDSRVANKSYGQNFIEALPDCTVTRGPLAELPAAAQEWLRRPIVS